MSLQQHTSPPKWPLRLLRYFIRKEYLEEIEGDMEEVFLDDLDQYSIAKSKRRYIWQVIKLMRPSLVRRVGRKRSYSHLGILKHNFSITIRNFRRYKSSFFINLIGLSTGLATSLFIYLWVVNELSVDTFHKNNKQLYWAMTHFDLTNGIVTWDYTSGGLAKAMKEDFPEVEEAVRVSNKFHTPRGVIYFEENNFEVEGMFAGTNFFEIMSYDLLIGNSRKVLSGTKSIAVSEELAVRMFGSGEAAMGQTVEWDNNLFHETFQVSGIFKSPPANATRQFDAVVNYELLINIDNHASAWNGGYAETYLVLNEGVNIDDFNDKIARYLSTKSDTHDAFTLFVQKYSDRYLYNQYDEGQLIGGRIEYVRLFIVVGIFILLIACINFMNLSTAQASRKMKEIGVKKSIGAGRSILVFQFLSESVLMAIFSFVMALMIVMLLLPQFNIITGKQLALDLGDHLYQMMAIVVFTGLIAGSYPAFLLSGFKPVAVLKGQYKNFAGEDMIRKGLVVVQFTISIIFIIGFIVLNRQISFTQTKNLGYNRDHVLKFVSRGERVGDPEAFRSGLKTIPGVVSASHTMGDFLWGNDNGSGYSWNDNPGNQNHLFLSPKIGYDVIETLGLEMVAGRSFSKNHNDDHTKIILNESAVKLMGLQDPVGTLLDYGQNQKREIVGVVKDFQYGSVHQKIEPLVIRLRKYGRDYLVRIKSGTEMNTIARIEELYKQFHPRYSFEPTFLDDDYEALYQSEIRVANISNYLAIMSILVSCLGLFGLAHFTAERRMKEMGIRKILGASVRNIMYLLTTSFTSTVFISILIALPIGFLLMREWLTNFAYAIELKWWFFVVSGFVAWLISGLTVGLQSFKTANVNPVNCLRDE